MAEEATCGKGIAANSTLPAKLGDLLAAVADVVDNHTKALDLDDANARQEYDAYLKLVELHRGAAAELHSLSEQMASYRDLPMGRHDIEALSAPPAAAVFGKLVTLEQELLSLLRERLDEHRPLLDQLRTASRR